jgi:hypothetical protein
MSRDSFRDSSRENDGGLERERSSPNRVRYVRSHLNESQPERENNAPRSERPSPETRTQPYSIGRRTFHLRESELHAMADIGTFRVVAADDLARFVYGGDASRMEYDLRRLQHQGLVTERTLPASGRGAIRVVGLTKTGKRLLRSTNRLPETQAIFHGIVKPREAQHDAALYRLFHKEAERIQNDGGRPLRVILDYELKRDLYRERARLGERQNDRGEVEALAERHGLKAVNGKIPLPDLRIEYQTAELELRRVDLELATQHYRPRGVAEKAKAGFALYSPREDASRLRRILDEQELTARIFAL